MITEAALSLVIVALMTACAVNILV